MCPRRARRWSASMLSWVMFICPAGGSSLCEMGSDVVFRHSIPLSVSVACLLSYYVVTICGKVCRVSRESCWFHQARKPLLTACGRKLKSARCWPRWTSFCQAYDGTVGSSLRRLRCLLPPHVEEDCTVLLLPPPAPVLPTWLSAWCFPSFFWTWCSWWVRCTMKIRNERDRHHGMNGTLPRSPTAIEFNCVMSSGPFVRMYMFHISEHRVRMFEQSPNGRSWYHWSSSSPLLDEVGQDVPWGEFVDHVHLVVPKCCLRQSKKSRNTISHDGNLDHSVSIRVFSEGWRHHAYSLSESVESPMVRENHRRLPSCPELIQVLHSGVGPGGVGKILSIEASSIVLRLSLFGYRHAVPLNSSAIKSTCWEIMIARMVRMSFLAMPLFLA